MIKVPAMVIDRVCVCDRRESDTGTDGGIICCR